MANTQPTVLIVDDDKAALQQLEQFLAHRGFHVAKAGCGDTALATVRSDHVDFVLSDIRMPGLKVDDMIAGMRAVNAALPIALMTGQPDADRELDLDRLCVQAVIRKPIDLRAVASILHGLR